MFHPLFDRLQDMYNARANATGAELLKIHANTLEQLTRQQAHFLTDCAESYNRQLQTLVNTKNPLAFQEIHYDYLIELQDKTLTLGRQCGELIAQAQAAINTQLAFTH